MTDFGDLLRNAHIVDKEGHRMDVGSLKGKGTRIGLYFSAHWCPPCRQFTPMLAECYMDMKEDKDKKFEIIFVSSDRDAKSCSEYYDSMPWWLLTFSDDNKDVTKEIKTRADVRGIPMLVILDDECKLIEANGRQEVMSAKGKVPSFLS